MKTKIRSTYEDMKVEKQILKTLKSTLELYKGQTIERPSLIWGMIRACLGLTKAQLSDFLEVESVTITRWERDSIASPTLSLNQYLKLIKLLKLLDIHVSDLPFNLRVIFDQGEIENCNIESILEKKAMN